MILLRCDANPTLGMGHLMRCRTLASALADLGQRCILVGPAREYALAGDDAIFCEWITLPFASSPATDAATLVELMSARSARMAVVDDYRADESYQLVLRSDDVSWLQFTDGPKRPIWADFALNPSPEAEAAAYRDALRNADTRLLLGPAFAMLRRDFTSPATPLPPPVPKQILVTFGGGDDRGAILKVLQALLPELPEDTRFVVVSGEHNPRNTAVAGWIAAHGAQRVRLHVNPVAIAPLISSCSLAVMAGGGTTYEANFCGLPMLLIAIAENQLAHSKAWQNAGAARYLGHLDDVRPQALLSEVRKALNAQREDGTTGTVRLVDGLGRTRVAKAMLERIAA